MVSLSPFFDKKYRLPRIWSNKELKKFAHLFTGDIVNISGWKDIDKEGKHYREYFISATKYYISNYKPECLGLQGFDNEFYLDLTHNVDKEYINRFDVVFNHTTLEHIYDVKKAFRNLCLMSKDIVIIVVPFLQPMHGDYGDYWRFTPLTVKKLFIENNLELLYLSFNSHRKSSVYIFAIGSKKPENWKNIIGNEFEHELQKNQSNGFKKYIGSKSIVNSLMFKIAKFLRCIK